MLLAAPQLAKKSKRQHNATEQMSLFNVGVLLARILLPLAPFWAALTKHCTEQRDERKQYYENNGQVEDQALNAAPRLKDRTNATAAKGAA